MLAALLAGCSSDNPTPSTSTTPTIAQPSVSASASPTSTLTPAQQEAFEQATDVAIPSADDVDLYTGVRTDVNDLNDVVATGDLLDASLRNASQALNQGYRANRPVHKSCSSRPSL